MGSSIWVQGLNEEQVQAVEHGTGPLLILAGAGSGKTSVLVHRCGHLISSGQANPEEVLVLTFTNKAAREIKGRVSAKLGDAAKNIWAGTFHGFGLSILKENAKSLGLPKNFGVVDQTDALAIIKDLLTRVRHGAKSDVDADKMLRLIALEPSAIEKAIEEEAYKDLAIHLRPKYQDQLKALGVVDFDGLIQKPIELFNLRPDLLSVYRDRYRHVMVDEFQDTNSVQMRLLRALGGDTPNLVVVGDDDQAIYGWRGADVSHILDFPRRYPTSRVVRLVQNYRSTQPILNLANAVIEKNENRHGKKLVATKDRQTGTLPEVFVYDDDIEEIEGTLRQLRHFNHKSISWKDMAVVYRSNTQGAMLEAELRKAKIPYKISGGLGFFDRKEVRDVLAYLQSAFRPSEIPFRRVLNVPPRGVGSKAVEAIEEAARSMGSSFSRAARHPTQIPLSSAAKEGLDGFLEFLSDLKTQMLAGADTPGAGMLKALEALGYKTMVLRSFKQHQAGLKRWQLLETFAQILDRFVEQGGRQESSVFEFLDAMLLRDLGEDQDGQDNAVSLMTLHASKGLEFSVVLLLGLEEGSLPHRRLGQDIAEERRLFYVGITRAKKHLVLSRAKHRKIQGRTKPCMPSRFLLDLPEKLFELYADGRRRAIKGGDRKAMIQALYAKIDAADKEAF